MEHFKKFERFVQNKAEELKKDFDLSTASKGTKLLRQLQLIANLDHNASNADDAEFTGNSSLTSSLFPSIGTSSTTTTSSSSALTRFEVDETAEFTTAQLVQVFAALRSVRLASNVTHVSFKNVSLVPCCNAITQYVQMSKCLTHLRLLHASLGDDSAVMILQCLVKENITLRQLSLAHNNLEHCDQAIVELLAKHPSLEYLDLSFNFFGGKEATEKLKKDRNIRNTKASKRAQGSSVDKASSDASPHLQTTTAGASGKDAAGLAGLVSGITAKLERHLSVSGVQSGSAVSLDADVATTTTTEDKFQEQDDMTGLIEAEDNGFLRIIRGLFNKSSIASSSVSAVRIQSTSPSLIGVVFAWNGITEASVFAATHIVLESCGGGGMHPSAANLATYNSRCASPVASSPNFREKSINLFEADADCETVVGAPLQLQAIDLMGVVDEHALRSGPKEMRESLSKYAKNEYKSTSIRGLGKSVKYVIKRANRQAAAIVRGDALEPATEEVAVSDDDEQEDIAQDDDEKDVEGVEMGGVEENDAVEVNECQPCDAGSGVLCSTLASAPVVDVADQAVMTDEVFAEATTGGHHPQAETELSQMKSTIEALTARLRENELQLSHLTSLVTLSHEERDDILSLVSGLHCRQCHDLHALEMKLADAQQQHNNKTASLQEEFQSQFQRQKFITAELESKLRSEQQVRIRLDEENARLAQSLLATKDALSREMMRPPAAVLSTVAAMTVVSASDIDHWEQANALQQSRFEQRLDEEIQTDDVYICSDNSSTLSSCQPGNAAAAESRPVGGGGDEEEEWGTEDSFQVVPKRGVRPDPSYSPMTKDRWVPDDTVENCGECERKFGLATRKHHCRRCGHVYCNRCAPKSRMHDGKRICKRCTRQRTVSPASTRGK